MPMFMRTAPMWKLRAIWGKRRGDHGAVEVLHEEGAGDQRNEEVGVRRFTHEHSMLNVRARAGDRLLGEELQGMAREINWNEVEEIGIQLQEKYPAD